MNGGRGYGRLACVSLPDHRPVLADGLAAAGLCAVFVDRPRARRGGGDPFQLARIAREVREEAEGLLLVVDRRWSVGRAAPGAVVGGIPTGVVFAGRASELGAWLEAVGFARRGRKVGAVLAMRHPDYLGMARRLAAKVRSVKGLTACRWFATEVSREELCSRLARCGPGLVVYVGHGHRHGFSGYGGLRMRHLKWVWPSRPCGAVLAVTCGTLQHGAGDEPFGMRWVGTGGCGAYFGAVGAVSTEGNSALAGHIGRLLETGKVLGLGILLRRLEQEVVKDGAGSAAWQALGQYRVVGNPLQGFV